MTDLSVAPRPTEKEKVSSSESDNLASLRIESTVDHSGAISASDLRTSIKQSATPRPEERLMKMSVAKLSFVLFYSRCFHFIRMKK